MSAVLQTIHEEPPFRDAAHALRFALRIDYAIYERSAIALISSSPRERNESGLILDGLERAGMAGMIGAQLASLPQLWRRILIARHCNRAKQCSVCHDGQLATMEWLIEVAWISATVWLDLQDQMPLLKEKRAVRDELVMKYFGRPLLLQDIAKKAGVHRHTMRDYEDKLKAVLRREERQARSAIEERLQSARLIP